VQQRPNVADICLGDQVTYAWVREALCSKKLAHTQTEIIRHWEGIILFYKGLLTDWIRNHDGTIEPVVWLLRRHIVRKIPVDVLRCVPANGNDRFEREAKW